MTTPLAHVQFALEHIRQAAEKRGPELDEVMRALCVGFTELKGVEKALLSSAANRRAA